MTLFEMKEKLFNMRNERKTIADWLVDKAADPNIPMEDIKAKQAKLKDMDERIAILQKSHDDEEDAQRKRLAMHQGGGDGVDGGVEDALGILLGQAGILCGDGDKLGFIHNKRSSFLCCKIVP